MRALNIAATGMSAQQLNVEVISNNISNLNTTGYKQRKANFEDLLYQNINKEIGVNTTQAGDQSPVGLQIGLGVKTSGITRNTEQGPLVQTQSTFDLAIQGRGFFQVTDANGNIFYTRAGNFQTNGDGVIVSQQGFEVDPTITIPENVREVTISPEGEVFASFDDDSAPTSLGRLTLVNFVNEAGLRPEGNNLLTETEASGTPIVSNPGEDGFGSLEQGFLENSNVDAVLEITNLISAQRVYELNSRVIRSADEMLNAVNQIR